MPDSEDAILRVPVSTGTTRPIGRRPCTEMVLAMSPHGESVADVDLRRNEIERLAYFLWQNAGQPSGTADRDWFLAEHAIETGPISSSNPTEP
jgi:Protein of unknown function (DUF2934)